MGGDGMGWSFQVFARKGREGILVGVDGSVVFGC